MQTSAGWLWLAFWPIATFIAVIRTFRGYGPDSQGHETRKVSLIHALRSREWAVSVLPWVACVFAGAALGIDAVNELVASPSLFAEAKMLALSALSLIALVKLWKVGRW